MNETEARIKITFTSYDEDTSDILKCLNYKADVAHLKGDLRKTGKTEKSGKYGKHDRYFSEFTLRNKGRLEISEELFKICEELSKIESKLKSINKNGSIDLTAIQYPPDFSPIHLEPELLKFLGKLGIGLSMENWV